MTEDTAPEPARFLHITSGPGGDVLVSISLIDASVTFGPKFTQDEASRVFWKGIEAYGKAEMAKRGRTQ